MRRRQLLLRLVTGLQLNDCYVPIKLDRVVVPGRLVATPVTSHDWLIQVGQIERLKEVINRRFIETIKSSICVTTAAVVQETDDFIQKTVIGVRAPRVELGAPSSRPRRSIAVAWFSADACKSSSDEPEFLVNLVIVLDDRDDVPFEPMDMTECKRMKEDDTQSGSVIKDVRSKWNSMSDAEKEPYITQSRNDSKEYKERRKAHENKGSQRYLKGCITILEVALFDFWSGCKAVPAYERTGVARIRTWGKEEVVRVMVKLKLDRAKKQERGDDGEGKQSNFDILMSELADIKKIQFYIMQRQSRVEEKLDRVEEKLERVKDTLERHKGVVEGKIYGVVKEVEVLRGEVVKEVEVLRGDLKMVTGEKFEGVVKEVMELRSELTGVKGVVDKYLDEGDQLKAKIKEMKSYVEKKYDELKKYEEEKREEEEEDMEEKREEEEEEMKEMRKKEVDVIYTPESVIAADLDSECPAPQKKKQKVEKADIPSGIDDIKAAICDYLWNSELESGYSVISMGNQFATVYDVATLKPTEWVGGVVIDLLAWTVCYDSQKSLQRIGYLPYHLAQQALDANSKVSVESIATFWGLILDNYVKFTDCEKIKITINYHNSHWYLLVLDMVDRVATIYDSMFTSEAAKQRVKDAKRLICIHDCGMYVMMWMESIGSTGATGDFAEENSSSPKNTSVIITVTIRYSASNQNGSKTSASEAGLSQSSSQPSSSQPQPPSETNDSSEEIRSFKTLNFRSDMEKQRWQTSFKVRKIRPERVIDLAGYDFVEKLGWKRVKEVRLYQDREEMDPISHEEEQPIRDAMMEEAPVAEDVIIKTVMEYMVNFREYIDSLVSGMRVDISSLRDEVSMLHDELHVDNQAVNEDEVDDEDDDNDDDDDPNKYIVSATPPSIKLLIFDLNGVLAYIPRLPADVVLRTRLFEFMQFCVDNFVVALWSSKMRHNVDRVLEKLHLFSEHFLFVWDQAKCKTYDNVTYCKDLNDVWNVCPDFNELYTLLVDDSAEKMIYNPKYNNIYPHTFDAASHSNDNALEKGENIREYLENLLKAPNVSDFVRNNPFSSD
ncbi:hypothetical protein F3Y22_tig00111025pilonHSYRG00033 [Hibiscus syriacus]|uniref:Ubiquitin-like protease family profile domain-containing protein n=1 Tax=Hibiscus syriacus TaxID=106335 RepID=A0A6A2Z624_HIBSY|nr:hypothetical protein F3Y22_tig00111025pilonHSYRG00033 [Hibiscus syriacus]